MESKHNDKTAVGQIYFFDPKAGFEVTPTLRSPDPAFARGGFFCLETDGGFSYRLYTWFTTTTEVFMRFLAVIVILSACAFVTGAGDGPENNWPTWRGPGSAGLALDGSPPAEWSETKNIRWKVAIPGKGLASPIVWGDLVFVQTAIETDETAEIEDVTSDGKKWAKKILPDKVLEFVILAYNRHDGSIVWQRTVNKSLPHEATHETASWASTSPVTDGESVFAYFGSNGLFSYSLAGDLIWKTDLGNMETRNSFGEGSSPALHGNTLVVNWDHEGDSFIVALDKNTGKEIWRRERDEPTSWSTPAIVDYNGRTQVIVSATNRIRGYDLSNGDNIWECSGMTLNVVPTPVISGGLVFVASGFRGDALMAIDFSKAEGDITGTEAVVWTHDADAPYVPSPLVVGDRVYFLKTNTEIMSSLDAKTGAVVIAPIRLEGIKGVYASPVATRDHIFFTGRNGTTVVIEAGSEFKIVSTNKLNDNFDASPAIVGDALYLRGKSMLYCISEN